MGGPPLTTRAVTSPLLLSSPCAGARLSLSLEPLLKKSTGLGFSLVTSSVGMTSAELFCTRRDDDPPVFVESLLLYLRQDGLIQNQNFGRFKKNLSWILVKI